LRHIFWTLLSRLRRFQGHMRYWWVNQNQTYRHELQGGYLWSPKRNANGARNPFYEAMREVSPGDLVFSFVDTRIFAIGIAQSYCYESPRVRQFGAELGKRRLACCGAVHAALEQGAAQRPYRDPAATTPRALRAVAVERQRTAIRLSDRTSAGASRSADWPGRGRGGADLGGRPRGKAPS
jgi:hypothetical protein